jgi:hypothetical protein
MKQKMKLSLPPKLVEKLVWVPVTCLIPYYAETGRSRPLIAWLLRITLIYREFDLKNCKPYTMVFTATFSCATWNKSYLWRKVVYLFFLSSDWDFTNHAWSCPHQALNTFGKSSMSTHNYYALDMVPKPLMSKLGITTMLLVLLESPWYA